MISLIQRWFLSLESSASSIDLKVQWNKNLRRCANICAIKFIALRFERNSLSFPLLQSFADTHKLPFSCDFSVNLNDNSISRDFDWIQVSTSTKNWTRTAKSRRRHPGERSRHNHFLLRQNEEVSNAIFTLHGKVIGKFHSNFPLSHRVRLLPAIDCCRAAAGWKSGHARHVKTNAKIFEEFRCAVSMSTLNFANCLLGFVFLIFVAPENISQFCHV